MNIVTKQSGRSQIDIDIKRFTKGFLYWDIELNDVTFTDECVGNGGYGEVYIAQGKNGEKFALKLFHNNKGEDCHILEKHRYNVGLIKRNLRSNIESGVLLTDYFVKPKIVPDLNSGHWYLMEYYRSMNVRDMIKKDPEIRKNKEFAGIVLTRYADMLSMIHGQGLIFQDNSWGNVLIGEDIKICDYDLMHKEGSIPINEGIGTVIYESREQILGNKLNKRSDLESFALMADHLITGKILRRTEKGRQMTLKEIDRIQEAAEKNIFNYEPSKDIPKNLAQTMAGVIRYPKDDSIIIQDFREAIRQDYGI